MKTSEIVIEDGKHLVKCVGIDLLDIKISLEVCERCPNYLRVEGETVICNFKSNIKTVNFPRDKTGSSRTKKITHGQYSNDAICL